MVHGADHDDDPETYPCYRHPAVQTALRCNACERPVCVDCAVHGAVGIKCPDCARTSRAARGVVPAARLALGITAGIAVAFIAGILLGVLHVAYFGIILAWVAGMGVGEATRAASGGYRDPVLARGAAAAAFIGIGGLPVLGALTSGSIGAGLAWSLIAAVFAAVGAFSRAS